jgi:cytochrome c biogenesis protein CcmG/thiol:disulfide interchange protein DsbE
VPDIEGKSPDGIPFTLEFAKMGRPTILYLFSPSCHWCSRNFDNMMALYQTTKSQYAFVGVSLSSNGVKDYVRSHTIDYPVVMDISTSLRQTYKFSATPTTVIVSTDNTVMKQWSGAYDGAMHKEIESYFKTKLPGLAAEEKTLAKN